MMFEPHPREFFAPAEAPPRLTNLREKIILLASFGIDRLFVIRFNGQFASLTADDFVARVLHEGLNTRWLLVGDDFRFGASRAGDFATLQAKSVEYGFALAAIETVTVGGVRVSSTCVREALEIGDLKRAQNFLGRPYSMTGRVVHGDKLGKQLGFPTANLRIGRNRPALSGIFAVRVSGVRKKPVEGVASVGVRPTVSASNKPALEVHLFDCAEDLYGAFLTVTFLHKLRDERKYPDVETLRRAIAQDVDQAKAYFSGVERTAGAQAI
jgi:riboflavin kinase / FMN adenylyltransferase